jgi:hypothetical protein
MLLLEPVHVVSETRRFDQVKIFVQNAPVDPAELPSTYLKCLELGKTYKACVISGRYYCLYSCSLLFSWQFTDCCGIFRAIQESSAYMCKTCRHSMLEHERVMTNTQHCPLCHTPLPTTNTSSSATSAGTHGATSSALVASSSAIGGGGSGMPLPHSIQTGAAAHGNVNNSIIAALKPIDSAAVGIGFGVKK